MALQICKAIFVCFIFRVILIPAFAGMTNYQ
jgi:hypothetical protein